MEILKDYVFYIVENIEIAQGEALQYGIKRCQTIMDHDIYFQSLLDMRPVVEDINISEGWNETFCKLAACGYIAFANSALEILDEQQLFILYLPSNPLDFQIKFLEDHIEQFSQNNFDVGVFGEEHQEFLKIRNHQDFSSIDFLTTYIQEHKQNNKQKNYISNK